MTKTLLASVLAAAIAVTSVSATPVRAADNGEIGRFLLGVGALFAIGSALSNSQNNRGHVTRNKPQREVTVSPRPQGRKFVPTACLRVNQFNHGPRRYFPRRCLHRNMRASQRLPGNCLRTVWSDRGQRSVYAARCLRNHGWRFS